MATLPVIRYPLDPTGVSPDNRVQGEVHAMVRRRQRVVAPLYGAFFTESLVVRDQATNAVLTKGVQYFAAELYELPTVRYGKEICAVVIVTDESVSDNVTLTYQALGGEFSTAADAVKQQIEALNLDDRPIAWGSIIAKPSEYPPSHHLHDIGDIFGFEYLVHSLERIRSAISFGDAASHDQIYQYIDLIKSQLEDLMSTSGGNLAVHINDFNNPHQVSPHQINAYEIPEVNALIEEIRQLLDAHHADHANPHLVTAAQINVYDKSQVYTKSEITDLTVAYVDTLRNDLQTQFNNLLALVTAHVNNFSNPHATGAAQVGAYSIAEVNALVAGASGAYRLYSQQQYYAFDWTATYDGLLHIWHGDEPRNDTYLYLNGTLVGRNHKFGGAGYGRIHHDTCAFRVGDHIQYSSTGSDPGFFNFYKA